MKAIILIQFVEEDPPEMLHGSTITIDVNETLAAEVRAGRIPNLELAILPASTVSYTGGVINLDELYPQALPADRQDGWNIYKESIWPKGGHIEGMFTEIKEGNDGQG